jgi:hypothetical protein
MDKKYKILVSGSTGLVGRHLCSYLKTKGHKVFRLVRSKEKLAADALFWDPQTGSFDKEAFEGFDAVIHLAGENLASFRWTKAKKDAVFLSRARDTWLLSQVLTRLNQPPKILISASAVGYYGNRGEEPLTEDSPPGKGFIADLCKKWEEATQSIENRGVRVVHTRFGFILSKDGGALPKMVHAYRLGLGGKLGNGRQIMPWVAIDDVVGAIEHCLLKEEISGAVNVVAPQPTRQADFAKTLADALHRPHIFHLPAWFLRLFLGEMAEELLLTSQNVICKRLLDTKYSFRQLQLAQIFKDLSNC